MSEEVPMLEEAPPDTTARVAPEEPVMPSAGSRLSAARIAAGLSIAEVARHLKLSPSQVEGLETGDYKKLPGPVFVRGFMRNYARLVNIDSVPLIAEVVAMQNQEAAALVAVEEPEEAIPFPGQTSWRWKPYASGLVLVVAALAAYEFFDAEPEAVTVAPSAVEAPPEKVAVPAEPVAEPVVEKNESAPLTAPSTMVAANSIPVVPAAPAKAVAVERSPNDKVLRFNFAREAWVEVRDAKGRVIFSQLNAAGSNQVVSGEPPLKLVIGNASDVKLVFGERPVDLAPFTQVDVARLTLE